MERRAFHFQIHFDDFFGVVPRAAGVGHEDGLKQTEERDGDEVADEEIRIQKRQAEREAKDDDEDVDQAFLCVAGADGNDALAVLEGGGFFVQPDVFLDEDDGAIGAGDDGLRARAGEPVDHRAAHEQAENDLRHDEAQAAHSVAEDAFEEHDDAKNHRGGTDDGGADQNGFGGRLEGIARPVAFFEFKFRAAEIGFEAEIFFDFRADIRQLLDAA